MLLSRRNTCPSGTGSSDQSGGRIYTYYTTSSSISRYIYACLVSVWTTLAPFAAASASNSLASADFRTAHIDLILGNWLQESADPLLHKGAPCSLETRCFLLCILVWSEYRESSRLALAWQPWILSVAGIQQSPNYKLQPNLACQTLYCISEIAGLLIGVNPWFQSSQRSVSISCKVCMDRIVLLIPDPK